LAAVVRNKVNLSNYGLSSLENNMLVVELMDAAKESAAQQKSIGLKE